MSESEGVSTVGDVEPPPSKQPLEIRERDGQWVVREYYPTTDAVEGSVDAFGTYDTQLDAMRDAKDLLERGRHPCLLRWDGEYSVGGLYWNEAFERLAVTYSDLLRAWVVTPDDGHVAFRAVDSKADAYRLGKGVLEQYDFERLVCYGADGDVETTREHRFLRHDITSSGVRFKRGHLPESVERPAAIEPTNAGGDRARTASGETDQHETDTDAVMSAVASAIPDITRLEPVETDGIVDIYRTPWEDGTARLWILDPEYDDHRTLVHAFASALDDWQDLSTHRGVAPVHEAGTPPATWVVCDRTGTPLPECRDTLPVTARLDILSQVADALGTLQQRERYRTGLTPDRVTVASEGSGYRTGGRRTETLTAHADGLGVRRQLCDELEQPAATRYTAPEQLGYEVTPTTPVYRLGALAYWLVAETSPFHDRQGYTLAIESGDLTPPSTVGGVPAAASDAILTAMATDPTDRYRTPSAFVDALRQTLD